MLCSIHVAVASLSQSRALAIFFFYYSCLHIYFSSPLVLLQLPPFRNSDPGGHSAGASLPPPRYDGAFLQFFIARRGQRFLPSPYGVELCIHTLGAFCKPMLNIEYCSSTAMPQSNHPPTTHLLELGLVIRAAEVGGRSTEAVDRSCRRRGW